jgi:hypothetical protein
MMKSYTRAGVPALRAAVAAALAAAAFAASAATIRVPHDVASIQGAIDAALAGDLVLVSPGTYEEVIDFKGKAIEVRSAKGADATIIDAGGRNSVVEFHSGEQRSSVLSGFTLRNGNAADYPLNGGGVNIVQASPTIEGNTITGNSACDGNGVGLYFSGALIKHNHIFGNHQNGCSGGTIGGGIYVGGAGDAEVTGNLIENNQTDMAGGGLGMNATGVIRVTRNTIRGNTSGNWGGGVATFNDSRPTFADNVVYGNTSPQGGGIALSVSSGSTGGNWVNNTVADNTGTRGGSELYTEGFVDGVRFINNVLRTTLGTSGILCDGTYSPDPPAFTTNDLYATGGTLLEGTCTNVLSKGGNMSVDPQFRGKRKTAGAYALGQSSPAIDAGTPTSLAGELDRAGHPRVLDGNGDGKAVIDLGAYEAAQD